VHSLSLWQMLNSWAHSIAAT